MINFSSQRETNFCLSIIKKYINEQRARQARAEISLTKLIEAVNKSGILISNENLNDNENNHINVRKNKKEPIKIVKKIKTEDTKQKDTVLKETLDISNSH